MKTSLTAADRLLLAEAKAVLDNPGLAARLTGLLGTPVEKGLEMLPARWNQKIQAGTRTALTKALEVAVGTLGARDAGPARNAWHKAGVALSGAVGGAFGLPALLLELPVSTTVMLRSIAEIARAEGEDLNEIEARLNCLEVFALGSRSRSDDGSESGYFVVRAALARAVSEAMQHIAERGLAREAAPALVRLIAAIASRFGVVVSQKAAAAAIPAVGAVGGAAVNTLFIDHFQKTAWGHFTVRRLEREYGPEIIRQAWDALDAGGGPARQP